MRSLARELKTRTDSYMLAQVELQPQCRRQPRRLAFGR